MLRFLSAALAVYLLAIAGLHHPRVLRGPDPDLTSPAAPGQVIAGLTPEAERLSDEALSRRLSASVMARIAGVSAVLLSTRPGESVPQAVERLRQLPLVEYAEPNHLLHATLAPNDSLFSGQTSYLDAIQATSAWDVEMGEHSVVVAVLDSGIDETHEDLENQLWTNLLEVPGNGVDDDHNGCVDDIHGCSIITPAKSDPSCNMPADNGIRDDNGHGTFVAGIIGAEANNGVGIAGAAPGVSLMSVKILDCLGGGTAADAAEGLLYAAKMGARVANLSFGADGESITLEKAIHEAYGTYGMVIVTASGNDGSAGITFPAVLPETIAVGSSGTPEDPNARSIFSDWGPQVDVVAPGQNIISTVPPAFCNVTWLCVQNGPYALASGTSFAAPLVSALAALIDSHTPNLSPAEVARIIKDTAEPLPDGNTPNWDGAGRIRMREALNVDRFYLGAPGISKQ
jgi:subtilisin family serine protease